VEVALAGGVNGRKVTGSTPHATTDALAIFTVPVATGSTYATPLS
jgi:hypothetical protein